MTIRLSAICLLACASFACQSRTDEPGHQATTRLVITDATVARASRLLDEARRHEPELTPVLQALARTQKAWLHGLDHRFKSRTSLERKIQTLHLRDEESAISNLVVDDVLRYRLLIEDEPAGHYDGSVRRILGALEKGGQSVHIVKNYWPTGDSYSGINCVLAFADGFRWELQFHTLGSFAASQEGHDLYEVMRLPSTSTAKKRRIFDRLASRWDWVRIPQGVLVPGSVHAKEILRKHERP